MSKTFNVSCLRYTLILHYILFWFFGILFLALSLWMIIVPATNYVVEIATSKLIQEQIYKLCYVTIVITVIIFVISLVGFYGTINNSRCTFLLSGICIFVVLISEIAVGILFILLQERVRVEMEYELSKSLSQYSGDDAMDTISIGWKETQKSFDCCGVSTNAGYQNHTNVITKDENGQSVIGSKWYREVGQTENKTWPLSCCENYSTCYTDEESLNKKGCLSQIDSFLRNHLFLFSILSFVTAVFQVVAVVLSFRMYTIAKYKQLIAPIGEVHGS